MPIKPLSSPALLTDALVSLFHFWFKLPTTDSSRRLYRASPDIQIKMRSQVADSIVIFETWWLQEYGRYTKQLPSRPVIIDIGGHIGTFSLFAAHRYPQAKIIAFEPNPDNYLLFSDNILLNKLSNIRVFNLAVTSQTGQQIKLFTNTRNTGMNSLVNPQDPNVFTSCDSISLADIFVKNHLEECDFLKMDCEGGEYDILLHTPVSTLKKINRIVLEYHPGGNIKDIENRLQKAGFRLQKAGFFAAPLLVASRQSPKI